MGIFVGFDKSIYIYKWNSKALQKILEFYIEKSHLQLAMM